MDLFRRKIRPLRDGLCIARASRREYEILFAFRLVIPWTGTVFGRSTEHLGMTGGTRYACIDTTAVKPIFPATGEI
jgi:hypothetical protein